MQKIKSQKSDNIYYCSFACKKYKKSGVRAVVKPPILDRRRVFVGTECKFSTTIGDYDMTEKLVVYTVIFAELLRLTYIRYNFL